MLWTRHPVTYWQLRDPAVCFAEQKTGGRGERLAVTSTGREVLSALGIVAVYAVAFWRIIRRNAGNKVIECGGIALVLLVRLQS